MTGMSTVMTGMGPVMPAMASIMTGISHIMPATSFNRTKPYRSVYFKHKAPQHAYAIAVAMY